MPMGLTNAPCTFQRVMNDALCDLPATGVYLDDLIVHSQTCEDHLAHLRSVFSRLRERQLHLKRSKCHFLQSSIRFLGHIVCASGVAPDPEKLSSIRSWPVPSSVKAL